MQPEPRKYLYDIKKAVMHIDDFAHSLTFDSYKRNAMARSAIERQLAIVGEALSQLAKDIAGNRQSYS